MKMFNIDDIHAGHPISTRCGRKARIISFDMKSCTPIVALVLNEETGVEELYSYYEDGRRLFKKDSPEDLVMKELVPPDEFTTQNLSKLESWVIMAELKRMFQIESKFNLEHKLKKYQYDPIIGYCWYDVYNYVTELVKEIRSRYKKEKSNVLVTDIWEYLLEKADKMQYSEYSEEKLTMGKFGKIEYGEKQFAYVLLSDRYLFRPPLISSGYFYHLKEKTTFCGSFYLDTGERHDTCKVIAIEDNISEDEAFVRYMYFLHSLYV